MKPFAWLGVAALCVGALSYYIAFEFPKAKALQQERDARLEAITQERRMANMRAEQEKREVLLSASPSEILVLAEECANQIREMYLSSDVFRWGFTEIDPKNYNAIKASVFQGIPISVSRPEASPRQAATITARHASEFIANGWAPQKFEFVISRTDDSFSGMTRSLRLYGCHISGTSVRAPRRRDNIVLR